MSWLDLLDEAGPQFHNADDLKRDLALAFVLEDAGFPVTNVDGKISGSCPFHEDSNPSFDLFGEDLDRWGCYPCGDNGDVFDLIGRLHGIEKFVLRKDKAAELLSKQISTNWTGPTKGSKRQYDKDEGDRVYLASQGSSGAWLGLYEDIAARNANVALCDPDILALDFQLGSMGADTIIPYFDKGMNLIAYKRRRPGGKPMSASGADYSDVFYAEWMDDGRAPVLLCEGESDVWAAHSALPTWTVLGLPNGAGSYPKQAHKLAGRHVVLAFDGDDAGRKALYVWYDALKDIAKSVRIVVMPDGEDLATLPDMPLAIDKAVSVPPAQTKISAKHDGIYTVPKSEKAESEALSNFTIVPGRQLVGEGVDAWECRMEPQGRSVVITSHDLRSKSQMVIWASQHGGSWYGSDTAAQYLQSWLQSVQPFLAAGFTTTVAGLHNGHFVFPGNSIGPDHWVYAAGHNDVEMGRYLTNLIPDGYFNFVEQLRLMRSLHSTAVMDPLLAWLALAPIRSLIDPFPTLAVLGGSGTGKTTLLETTLRAFSGAEIGVNLASTTRYAVQAMVASTNAFPVWFDEYRPGASKDALLAIDQIVRDAYNGHGSIKGGMGDHWAQIKLLKSEAPLIVSGEDAFTETSHLERIIPLYLPMQGRNPDALHQIQHNGPTGFAWKWLEIIRYAIVTDTLDTKVKPVKLAGLAPRMQTNLGVLQLGWDLLSHYAEVIGKADLGPPDWSLVTATWTKEAQGSPVLDALKWILDEPNATDFMAVDAVNLYIKPMNFVTYVKRNSAFVLPGNSKAVERILIEQYGGERTRTRIFGEQVRVISIPKHTLNEVE